MAAARRVPAVPPTVAAVLDAAVAHRPDAEALVTRTHRIGYAELDHQCNRAANALRSLGIAPGDRVAASLPNEADVVFAFHGAMRIGAIWVGVNRALAAPEKAYLLDDSGSSVLLCDQATAEQLRGVDRVRSLRNVLTVDPDDTTGEWQAALAAADATPVAFDVDAHAPAGIAYTSGTTGYPKGAVHSQANLILPGAVLVATRGYGPELRKGDCLPLTILNLMVLSTLLVAQAQGCCIVMDRIDAEGVASWIREERVTTWNGPPALLHHLALDEDVPADALRTLDDVWSGGADCPETVRRMFEEKFGPPVVSTYGLSEAPTVVSIDPRHGAHVPGGSGRPLPHLAVRVADETGADVAPGDVGEICIGPAHGGPWAGRYRPMLGYWQQPEATAEALREGELRTGDIGFLHPDGHLVVRDRKSLMIIRGGANVYPAEVERVLHDAAGVAACAVVGVADERLGERVVAAVELQPGAALTGDALQRHCLARLARYKVPEQIVFVDRLPRNAMGKIVRRDLPGLFA